MSSQEPRQRQRRRAVNGVVLLDKPVGLSSNEALQRVKRCFRAKKAGHTGSLDPLASGMLPLCLGEATKFSQFLLEADKRYHVVAQLGSTTQTGDAEGDIVKQREVPTYQADDLAAVLARFVGEIEQVPSMYSAIKHQGQPLYKLARQGIEVERKVRRVTIYHLQQLAFEGTQLTLDVRCSKGTYVRTLVEDLGEALGCGAHVAQLRRLASGPYQAEQMLTLTQLENADDMSRQGYLHPVGSTVTQWPAVTLSSSLTYYLQMGQPVLVPHAPTRGWVRLLGGDDRFLGVGEVLDDGRVAPRRLVAKAAKKEAS